MAYDNINSHKNQEFTISLADTFSKKNTGEVKLSPQPFLDQEYFDEPVTNFYSRFGNCIKPVTFIYINTVLGNNFPKQYHALNTVLRLLHSYAEISNIF